MRIDFHRNFDKRFAKLTNEQFKARLTEFVQDPYHPTLNNHALRGKFHGYRSINITGNIRGIFIFHSKNHAEFVDIGSHSQLYG